MLSLLSSSPLDDDVTLSQVFLKRSPARLSMWSIEKSERNFRSFEAIFAMCFRCDCNCNWKWSSEESFLNKEPLKNYLPWCIDAANGCVLPASSIKYQRQQIQQPGVIVYCKHPFDIPIVEIIQVLLRGDAPNAN